jgi:hypothetical protein|uniref:Uncharacterized protein n=1 Tax=Picea sitchensis TaxID=3332 RepID=A0A6B9XX77_PICSI|nr:hypothetical protein Q903MT_gene4220 [Picea sitchensis]
MEKAGQDVIGKTMDNLVVIMLNVQKAIILGLGMLLIISLDKVHKGFYPHFCLPICLRFKYHTYPQLCVHHAP